MTIAGAARGGPDFDLRRPARKQDFPNRYRSRARAGRIAGRGRLSGLFNVELVRRRWDEHQSGARNWQYPLWTVRMAQAWRRRWLGPSRPDHGSADAGPWRRGARDPGQTSDRDERLAE